MSRDELRKEWELRIANFRSSGQTQAEWCAANDVKLHQLHYWLKKSKSSHPSSVSSKWVSITMDEALDSKGTLQIKIGQASIEVKPGFDPTFLADVIRTLRSLC